MKRPAVIVVAVLVLLVASVFVARYLSNDTVERAKVTELLRAQIAGDASAMLARLEDCGDRACVRTVRDNAERLRRDAELRIALYQSQTAHAVASRTKFTRVVWFPAGSGSETTVQCVLVRRKVNVIAGTTVSLLRITAPIGRESSCPS
ncbi:MAG: hypothetical protein Q8O56_17260 [Solirubrobacteraceae bacterium]|nr:hypothetical protein [Solirubrobacteraceae bacterium]